MATRKTTTKKTTTKKAAPKRKLTEAEQEAAAEMAKAKKAEAEAKKLAKQAEQAKKKAAAEAEKAKKREKAEGELEKDAKEINYRMEQAEKMDVKADDHRLSAAIRMAEAKERCKDAGLKFNDWAEEYLKNAEGKPLSPVTIRAMLPIGAAGMDDPDKGMLMLEDKRKKNAAANKKMRDKKKAAAASQSKDPERKKEPLERATEAVEAAKTKSEKQNIARAVAEKQGLAVMPADEAKKLKDAAKSSEEDSKLSQRELMEQRFQRMSQKGKVDFVKWAAKELGGTFEFDEEEEDPLEIPEKLKRTKK